MEEHYFCQYFTSFHRYPKQALNLTVFYRHCRSLTQVRLSTVGKGHTELVQSKGRKHAQTDWQWLLTPDGSGDAASCQDDAGQQAQLDSIWLSVGNAVAAKSVKGTDRAACGD